MEQVGGGVIGTEFASMFSRLGVRVTIVDRAERVLCFLDTQIGEALQYHLRSRGMALDAKVDHFVDSAFNYPTLAECYRVAALNGINKLG